MTGPFTLEVFARERVEMRLLELLQYVGPHGIGNARPVFLLKDAEAFAARAVGKGHLRLKLKQGAVRLDAIDAACEAWGPETTLLVDNVDPQKRGGTGIVVDWRPAAIAAMRQRVVHTLCVGAG